MSKTQEINEYENDTTYVIEFDNTNDWDNLFEYDSEEEEEKMNNPRQYYEDLCTRVSTTLSHRWLSLDDLYNIFGGYDTRASISMAIGKLDKEHRILFANNTFSLKRLKT